MRKLNRSSDLVSSVSSRLNPGNKQAEENWILARLKFSL